MSEYWKSTPKYWCKFCTVYVRDTKIERQNHEATGRHQGNIQRSLRGLHRDHEKEEREKQRAKDEVARLNGVVGGAKAQDAPATSAPWKRATASGAPAPRQASVEDRKRQMQQLADMGVAIPEEYRRDMAMAGDWQTVAVNRVSGAQNIKAEDEDMKLDSKSIGVRKRKLDGEEDENDAAEYKRPQWGSTRRTFTGTKKEEVDFDALLGASMTTIKPDLVLEEESKVKAENAESDALLPKPEVPADAEATMEAPAKTEPSPTLDDKATSTAPAAESNAAGSGVIFKKRKKKA